MQPRAGSRSGIGIACVAGEKGTATRASRPRGESAHLDVLAPGKPARVEDPNHIGFGVPVPGAIDRDRYEPRGLGIGLDVQLAADSLEQLEGLGLPTLDAEHDDHFAPEARRSCATLAG